MNVNVILDPSKAGGDHVRLAFDDKADVTDECFVKNRVDRLAVVMPAFGNAFYCSASGFHEVKNKNPVAVAPGSDRIYFASIQLSPEPTSTTRGTSSFAAASISRLMISDAVFTSFIGPSKRSSS